MRKVGGVLRLYLLYRDLQAQVAALAAFLREGLAGGETCLVVYRGDRSRFEAALGLDAPGLRLFPAERLARCRRPEALLRRLLRALPVQRLRIAVDFGAPDPGPSPWERALQEVAGDAVLLCQIDVSQVSDEALAERVSRHPWLLLGGPLRPEREAADVVVDLLPLLCHRDGALEACLRGAGQGFTLTDGRALEGLLPDERAVVDVALERLGETFRRVAAERERRLGEERLQALVESASDMVFILDPDATIRYAGPSVERLLGYHPEDLVGQDALLWVHPEDGPSVREALLQCLATGRAWFEARVRRRDGAWRTVEVQAADRVDHPAVGGIVVNSRDITDRRLLERQLLQSQKMEALGRLAGGVAHDFNNLLTVIAGGTEFLLQREPKLAPDLEEILAATRRAANLTRQLLAFSRRQAVNLRVLEVDATVEDLERLFRRLIGEDVELVTRLGARGVCVRADHAQLEQVVLNLVVNARDAMPQGGRLTVSTSVVDGAWLRLRVEDTGVGIPPDAQPRIFEPFFTTRAGGTGLGLATVYGIVQGSGGHIRFDSRPGEGTRFEVDLPVVVQPTQEAPPPETPAPPLPGNETILVVEDEVVLRRMTRRILEGSGYRVLEADGGLAALEVADGYDGRIDLLLSDVVMPRLNGWELAMEMLRRRPGVRLVFTSGYTSDTVLDAGMLQRGEIVFLEKPYGPKELLRTVRNVLDRGPHGLTRISAGGAA